MAVVPDLPGSAADDEGFAVWSDAAVDLAGYTVDDGEGVWTFPVGTSLEAGQTLWVTGNLSAWTAKQGPSPTLPLAAGAMQGRLQLGNDADSLTLRDASGAELDFVAWGDDAEARPDALQMSSPGLVHKRVVRNGTWMNTGSASDWQTPRPHRIGESSISPASFEVDSLTLYACPDACFVVLTGVIAAATERLHLHVYEFRHAELADALIAAKARNPGLDLQVLVDGSPVGADSFDRHATADVLKRIQAVGGAVVMAGSGRYDDHHLKVLVADAAVAVQSENWVPSGVPVDPSWGNRGWGAVAHDAEMADWFAAILAADRAAWDTEAFDLASYDPLFEAPYRAVPRSGDYRPPVKPMHLEGPVHVTPVISPDHSAEPWNDPVARVAASARNRLDVQQLDATVWASSPTRWSAQDSLTASIVTAARAGALVRVQASAPFSSTDTGNREAMGWLELEEPSIATGTLDRPGLATQHNKGFLVDDRVVLVGSMNANHHSRSENREVGLLIESPAAVSYFRGIFEADWAGTGPPRDTSSIGDDLKAIPMAPVPMLLAVLGLVVARRSRP